MLTGRLDSDGRGVFAGVFVGGGFDKEHVWYFARAPDENQIAFLDILVQRLRGHCWLCGCLFVAGWEEGEAVTVSRV